MSDTRSVRPADTVPPADCASITGLTRKFMAFAYVDS